MTTAQSLRALQTANAIRSYRAELKRNLAAAEPRWEALRACADVLAQDPVCSELATMKVKDLVLACRGMGQAKANLICLPAAVSDSLRLRDLTERQRGILVAQLLMKASLQERTPSRRRTAA